MHGDRDHVWYRRWTRVAHLNYDLPGGATGRDFVSLLSEEVSRLARHELRSESLIDYLAVMLERDALVKKTADVHHQLKRHLDAWRSSQIEELLYEAKRCSQQLHKPYHGRR